MRFRFRLTGNELVFRIGRYINFALSSLPALLPLIFASVVVVTKIPIYNNIFGMPMSDSQGWFACIKSLAYFNQWDVQNMEWCNRRPYYPMLASIPYRISGNLEIYFLITSTVFGICIRVLQSELKNVFSNFFHFLFIAGLLCTWFIFGAVQILTEQYGIMLTTLTCAFFLRFLRTQKSKDLYVFAICLLIAQQIRPANSLLYLVPIILCLRYSKSGTVKSFVRLIFGIYVPILSLPLFIRDFSGQDSFMHGLNKWFTIYALQFGNIRWGDAYNAIPRTITSDIEQGAYLRDQVLSSIGTNPLAILSSVIQNLASLAIQPFANPKIFWWIPSIAILAIAILMFPRIIHFFAINRNEPLLSLMTLILILSEVIHVGMFYKSDFIRTLSTSYIFTGLLVFLVLDNIRFDKFANFVEAPLQLRHRTAYGKFIFFSFLPLFLVLMFVAHTPNRQLATPGFQTTSGECSTLISFEAQKSGLVQIEEIRDWSNKSLGAQGLFNEVGLKKITLFSVTALDSAKRPQTFAFYIPADVSKYRSRQVVVCIKPNPIVAGFSAARIEK